MKKSAVEQLSKNFFFSRLLGRKRITSHLLKDSTVIFLYHECSDSPSQFYSLYHLNITPSLFEKHIQVIIDMFHVITPRQLLSGDYKRPAALITFDDGARGYFENAIEILEKYQCPSLIFLNMAPILNDEIFWSGLVTYLCEFDKDFVKKVVLRKVPKATTDFHVYVHPKDVEVYLQNKEKEKILMSVREFYGKFATKTHLDACCRNKLVYFGNHLFNHYNCPPLSDEEIDAAYNRNQEEIEKYPNATKCFSYPYGQEGTCYNDRTTKVILRCGGEAIFTAQPKSFQANSERIFHRVSMGDELKTEAQIRSQLTLYRIKQMFHG